MTENETKKKEEQISQPVCWMPCGSSRGKFRPKTPDGSKLSRCGAGFPATEPSHGTDCNRLPLSTKQKLTERRLLQLYVGLEVQFVGLAKKERFITGIPDAFRKSESRIYAVKYALPEMQLDGQLSTKKSIAVTCVPQIALLALL